MPAEPFFLDVDLVLRIHKSVIEQYGGGAGLRDQRLLESAVAMPQASFEGTLLHADLFEMAAAYLFHLVGNHPFVDGNKRVGAASAIIFLAMNGIEIEADEDGLVELTLKAARGEGEKGEIAEFFRNRALRSPTEPSE
ncbi:MAG TPA: type II toxin-antitoxin system death-on-curing family toxin [Planctomycetaceae bacterium]|nr:type II toxin-antitoxin system death-on-curing family toxin [Planctomycetaceae bacterium]